MLLQIVLQDPYNTETVVRMCSVKKVFLKICRPQGCNFIKKETLSQMFSCEFCEVFKNIFFIEHLWWLLLALHESHSLQFQAARTTCINFIFSSLTSSAIFHLTFTPSSFTCMRIQTYSSFQCTTLNVFCPFSFRGTHKSRPV